MTMTDGLIAFVTARLDEDEAMAKAATEAPWSWEATGQKDSSWAVGQVQDDDGTPLAGQLHGNGVVIDGVCESINGNLDDAAHIARHDPARVLREVEAKREILTAYIKVNADGHRGEGWISLRFAVEALVAAWSDHPDYRAEWA